MEENKREREEKTAVQSEELKEEFSGYEFRIGCRLVFRCPFEYEGRSDKCKDINKPNMA